MSNTNGRLFRLGDMLGRSSHYSGNRRSFGTLSAPSTSIAGVQAVLVVSVVASGALEETDISGDASGFVAAALLLLCASMPPALAQAAMAPLIS